jgi:hypothetical protein
MGSAQSPPAGVSDVVTKPVVTPFACDVSYMRKVVERALIVPLVDTSNFILLHVFEDLMKKATRGIAPCRTSDSCSARILLSCGSGALPLTDFDIRRYPELI